MLYIFNQDDKYQNIITEETGLIDTWFKDYQNHLIDEPFVFYVESDSDLLHLIKDENQVAFYDRDNRLRLMRIRGLHERSTSDGYIVEVKCEPSFLELYDHFIEDKRVTNGTAQTALNRGLEGSRFVGEVTVDLGLQTTNFYWTNGIDGIFNIIETWGGALVDVIELDENNEIVTRKIIIQQRLGADNGLIIEPDYNAESIERSTLSYPVTAMWGQGASLETENGGYTRYITFEDVEWKVSNGDPVDKPKGQKWVGDSQALQKYGYLHNNQRMHRFGHFSNQEYETAEELLMATWLHLQEAKHPEVNHESTINVDRPVSLGDTATIVDRNYNKPIEVQSQITGLEYDILEPDEQVKVVLGKYVDMNVEPFEKDIENLKNEVSKPRPTKPIDNSSYPDVKPGTPTNVQAIGSFQVIQLYWDYDSAIYVSHYEVYASKIKDFVPDSQYLIYRGRVSAFGHEVQTDEMWYYRIRAVNTRGTPSDNSAQVSAASVRINTPDIMFGGIIADHLQNNLDIADKLAQNTIDKINQGPIQEIVYTQQQIEATEEAILNQLNSQIGDVNSAISSLLDKTNGLEGTVTNVEQRVDTISGELQTTITELSNIDGVVSQHTLDIQANAAGLSAKAEKSEVYTKTEVNTRLNNKVETTVYNNKMGQLDVSINNITGRVSNTETKINSLTGEVNTAKSQIGQLEVKADQVEISVSEIRTDFNNLEIGGRNLILGSATPYTYAVTSNDFNYWIAYHGLERNTTYTFSAKVEVLQGSVDTVSLYPYVQSGQNMTRTEMPIVNGKVKGTFTTDGRYDYNLLVYNGRAGATAGNQIRLIEYQLEKGNKATDWTPAPEDIDSRVTTAEASITTLAGEINLKASQTSVNSLTGRMSSAESQLNVLPGQISAKVDKDGVIAQINLSSEGLRIDGNKHHITGQTLIDDAVIGTAAIANAAIAKAHLQNAIIDDAHINNMSGTKIIAKTVNADKLNVNELRAVSARTGNLDVTGDITLTQVNMGIYMSFSNMDVPTGGSVQRLMTGDGRLAKHNLRFTGRFLQDNQGWRNADTLIGLDHVLLREYFRNSDGTNGNVAYRTDFTASELFMTNVGGGNSNPQQYAKLNYDNLEIKNYNEHAYYRGNMTRIDGPEYSIEANTGEAFFRFINGASAKIVRSTRIYQNQSSASGGLPVYITPSANNLFVATSSEKFKINIERGARASDYNILNVPIARWNDKKSMELYAELLAEEASGIYVDWENDERALMIENLNQSVGVIAEDLHDAGLSDYVIYSDKLKTRENVLTIDYSRLTVPLMAVVQKHDLRFYEHEKRLDEKDLEMQYLKQKIKQQDLEIKQLKELMEAS